MSQEWHGLSAIPGAGTVLAWRAAAKATVRVGPGGTRGFQDGPASGKRPSCQSLRTRIESFAEMM
jgi:hypothetical protein